MGIFKRKITVEDNAVTSAIHLTLRQSLLPNALVMILFFLWGFAYGLLDVLNSHFQTTLNITASKSSGLQASYFGAYFICPLTISGWIARKYGFRVTFMTGLAVLAVGCLLFWPSGVKKSFGGFCGSMFVVGAGLSTLETAADPFLSICGPPKYSEIRLNLGQAVQGVGTFVAPLLASRVFFANTVDDNAGLKNVQWTYLGVACFVALLIILFWLAPFPEITDADQEALEAQISEHGEDTGPFKKQYNLFFGVWSQFCYVGAQVAVAGYFINFCKEAGKTSAESSDLLAIAQGLYAFNRFVATGLMMMKAFKPRYMLTVYLILCCVFSIAAMTTKGYTSVAMIILVLCFESCCFATIFSLALRGLGRHTKRGGSLLVAAISGGMVFPPMMGAIVTNKNAHIAMAIPMMGFVLALAFPVYVNVFNKDVMDSHRNTELNVTISVGKDIALEEGPQSKPTTATIETAEETRAIS
ncbi:Major facilitator superfamily domain general substrate transporter [Penicillium samsonianum]|uniref:Major facilitator superfamily domain general substrate transporter n=1 Tax=Penicillium samsonianum TaxID=1882272 RepID=UPI002549A42A|nr:Major facilitator superfamily domain general substrate transporter [Penicillium samsonianum]KAJ6143474.1 Major facilitator superfamily domain general substrate transporter [Penicillium samsonianum]